MENQPEFKAPIQENSNKSIDWQSFAVGVFVGFISTLAIFWYINRNDNPYGWCFYLDKTKSSYCVDLYEQATKKMQKYSDIQETQNDGGFGDDYNFR